MTEPTQGWPTGAAADVAPAGAGASDVGATANDPAVRAEVEAARERQSHVRHELRGPLAVIYPLLSHLLEEGAGELAPAQRGFLEVLERNVMRLEALVTGVADSGWADCSAAAHVPSAVALAEVVDEVVMVHSAQERGARLFVEPALSAASRVWADRDDVRQVVTNLVRNAVRYASAEGAEGKVSLRVELEASDFVAVVIEDDGPGIPADELPQVFDFGFRGELARQLKVPGLGAGLWICRQLAARNAGAVELCSESGAGTRATLILPVAREDAQKRPDDASAGL